MKAEFLRALDEYFCANYSDYVRLSAIEGYEMPEMLYVSDDGNVARRDSACMRLVHQPRCEELLERFKQSLADTTFTFSFSFPTLRERWHDRFEKHTFARLLPEALHHSGETAESVTASGEYSGISFTVIVSRAVAADTSVTFQGNALKLTDSVVSGVKLITVAILPGLSGELAFWVQGQKVYGLELTFILSVDDTPDEPEAPDDPLVPGEGELQPGDSAQGGSSGNATGGGSSGNGGGQGSGQAVNVSLSDEGKKTLVIVGSSVGGAVVLAGVIILVVVLTKKKKK